MKIFKVIREFFQGPKYTPAYRTDNGRTERSLTPRRFSDNSWPPVTPNSSSLRKKPTDYD